MAEWRSMPDTAPWGVGEFIERQMGCRAEGRLSNDSYKKAWSQPQVS